jgi:DNA repair exonuclease SbcCD nuclease subunit
MGVAYRGLGEKSDKAKEKRYKAAENIVRIAKDSKVDFVLIAGDLFDGEAVGNSVVRRVVKILNDFAPTSVYIIPGNHDPFRPESVWARWSGIKEHVHLLTEAEEVAIDQSVTLYPSPLTQKEGNIDPTEWIPKRQDERIRIGLAHGSLSKISDISNFPISCNRCLDSGLDYLALGDWHGHYQEGNIVYSGSIEPFKFGDDKAGSVSIVTIAAPGATPVVEVKPCKLLSWVSISRTVADEASLASLEAEIEKLPNPANTVLKVEVIVPHGVAKEVIDRLTDLRLELEGECFSLKYELDADPLAQLDPSNIPAGTMKQVDEVLDAIASGNALPAGITTTADKETAAKARAILLKIAGREEP